METITEIQTVLDDKKESVPDNLYLTLCNHLKTLYENENYNVSDIQNLENVIEDLYEKLANLQDVLAIERASYAHIETMLKSYEVGWKNSIEECELLSKIVIQQRNKFYTTCVCGKNILKTSLYKHKKSKKCREFREQAV